MTKRNGQPVHDPLRDKLYTLVEDLLGCDRGQMSPTALLRDDLELDELDIIDITMELEERFDIEILDDSAMDWKTLGDVEGYLKHHCPKAIKEPKP